MKINARDNIELLLENIEFFAETIQPLWHPLGFVSCLIKGDSGVSSFRLHYWPANERRTKNPDWPVHTHTYALSSFILSGKIEDIQYKTIEGDDYSIYEVAYLNGNSEISNTGKKISISQKISATRTKGDQYRVERGVFHQSFVDISESAVTFVALSELSNGAPLVLGHDGDHRYPYDRTPFDRELFWSVIRKSIDN